MGRLETFETEIPQLKRTRTIRVLLPAAYDESADERFPVLYMQDAQNLFVDELSYIKYCWQVPAAMEAAEKEGLTRGVIVVGVDNGQARSEEYNPWRNYTLGELKGDNRVIGGEGKLYAQFMAETLKPLIDEKYRTLKTQKHTWLAGSSFGGMISAYTALKYPKVYSVVGIFSLASWLAEEQLLSLATAKKAPKGQRYFIHSGDSEGGKDATGDHRNVMIRCAENFRDALLAAGLPEADIDYAIHEGDIHNERAWAAHFPDFLRFALKTAK